MHKALGPTLYAETGASTRHPHHPTQSVQASIVGRSKWASTHPLAPFPILSRPAMPAGAGVVPQTSKGIKWGRDSVVFWLHLPWICCSTYLCTAPTARPNGRSAGRANPVPIQKELAAAHLQRLFHLPFSFPDLDFPAVFQKLANNVHHNGTDGAGQ